MPSTPRSLAAAITPPPPPTFLPTPIGQPPGPPTPSPTATPLGAGATATATPAAAGTSTVTATPGATGTPTVVTTSEIQFSLDAARVSKVGNPGDFQGLASVKHGSHVWLMMYYTIKQLPHAVKRTTTYTITGPSKTVFKVAYQSNEKRLDVGRFSRYTVYTVPSNLPFGKYHFKATLTLGKLVATRTWSFQVGKQERVATTAGSK